MGSRSTTKGQFMPSFDLTSSPGPPYLVVKATGAASPQKTCVLVSRPSFQQSAGTVIGKVMAKTPLSSLLEKSSSAV